MGVFGSIGGMMSNPDYKRFVQFGRAWQAGWRPNNYSMSDGVSDWKQQLLNWYNSYGSIYDVNEAINYWNNLREKEYDSSALDGLQINLPIMSGSSKGFGVGDAVAVGNLGLSALNYYQQAQLQKAQLAQIQANNALSYQMFVEGNRYNSAEAEAAFRRSFDASKYTTQAGLMRNAGLNPAMMYGEGSTISPPSSQSASSMSSPALQSAVGVNAPVFDILGFANAFKALADAKKAGAETRTMESILNETVRSLELRNDYQETINSYQGKLSATQIAKMIQDIEKQYVEIDNLIKEGNLTDAQTALNKVNKEIAEENKGLASAERELKQALADKREEYTTNILNQQKEEINTTKKQGNMYTQQGKAAIMQGEAAQTSARAQAEDLRATRQARINQLNADAREKNSLAAINDYELDTRPSKIIASYHNFVDMVTSTVSATTSVSYLTKELELIGQEIEAAKKHNDWYLVNQLMDNAKDIAISIGSIAIARKNFGTTGKATPVGFKNYK